MRRINVLAVGFVIMMSGLTACERLALVQDLEQKDANEILVILSKHGVKARQEVVTRQQESSWSIFVAPDDEQQAREILVANQLPRKKELGLSGICKDAGMIPTPKTEKCRELLGLKGEIINSLESIPGVVNADVVINIPDKEDFPDENTPINRPSSSVVVQIGESAPGENIVTEAKIQQFVANAVPGMDTRDVAVIISRVGYVSQPLPEESTDPTVSEGVSEGENSEGGNPGEEITDPNTEWVSFGGLTLEASSATKLKILLVFFLGFFALLAAGLVFVVFRLAQARQRGSSLRTGEGGGVPQIPEKVAMDRLVEQTGQAQKR